MKEFIDRLPAGRNISCFGPRLKFLYDWYFLDSLEFISNMQGSVLWLIRPLLHLVLANDFWPQLRYRNSAMSQQRSRCWLRYIPYLTPDNIMAADCFSDCFSHSFNDVIVTRMPTSAISNQTRKPCWSISTYQIMPTTQTFLVHVQNRKYSSLATGKVCISIQCDLLYEGNGLWTISKCNPLRADRL